MAERQHIAERLGQGCEQIIFAGRWLLAPIYFGLLLALLLVVVKFVLALATAFPALAGMSVRDLLLVILKLLDLALIGNLLVMVMLGGWENFIAPVLVDSRTLRPEWLEHLDFNALKMKLIGSIIAIAGIDLLDTFFNIDRVPPDIRLWDVAIFLAFAVSGVLMALMDRLGRSGHDGGG